jgi:hypothetical protein
MISTEQKLLIYFLFPLPISRFRNLSLGEPALVLLFLYRIYIVVWFLIWELRDNSSRKKCTGGIVRSLVAWILLAILFSWVGLVEVPGRDRAKVCLATIQDSSLL